MFLKALTLKFFHKLMYLQTGINHQGSLLSGRCAFVLNRLAIGTSNGHLLQKIIQNLQHQVPSLLTGLLYGCLHGSLLCLILNFGQTHHLIVGSKLMIILSNECNQVIPKLGRIKQHPIGQLTSLRVVSQSFLNSSLVLFSPLQELSINIWN